MKSIGHSFMNLELLTGISELFKTVCFSFTGLFFSNFDKNLVDFYEFLIKTSFTENEDENSPFILQCVLESIRLITSKDVKEYPSLVVIYEEFDTSLFGHLLSFPNSNIVNLAIHSSLNFVLSGHADKFQEDTISMYKMTFFDVAFENQSELGLFFMNYTYVSPIEIKLSFMTDQQYVERICDVITTVNFGLGLKILEIFVEILKGCIVDGVLYSDVNETFLNSDFLSLFDTIESNNTLTEDQQLQLDSLSEFCSKLLLTPE